MWLGTGTVAGSCRCGNEPSHPIKCVQFLDWGHVSFSGRTVLRGVSCEYIKYAVADSWQAGLSNLGVGPKINDSWPYKFNVLWSVPENLEKWLCVVNTAVETGNFLSSWGYIGFTPCCQPGCVWEVLPPTPTHVFSHRATSLKPDRLRLVFGRILARIWAACCCDVGPWSSSSVRPGTCPDVIPVCS